MISDVYLFRDQHVIAYEGVDVAINGPIQAEFETILADSNDETRWHVGNWGKGIRAVSKSEFVRVAGEMIEKKSSVS